MQPDRRLAGAGGALDAQRLGQAGADDGVLLGLDGGDDVAHRPGPRALDLRLQDVGAATAADGPGPRPRTRSSGRGRSRTGGGGVRPSAGRAAPGRRAGTCRPASRSPSARRRPRRSRAGGRCRASRPARRPGRPRSPAGRRTAARRGSPQRLHPPIQGLLQMLGGDVVAADRGQPGGVLTHPPQGGPGLGEVVLFSAQDVGGCFGTQAPPILIGKGFGSEGPRYSPAHRPST